MSRSETGLSPKEEMPQCCTEEHLTFLDVLRESGVTNMYGAGKYLEDKFWMGSDQARETLRYWMATFTDRNPS